MMIQGGILPIIFLHFLFFSQVEAEVTLVTNGTIYTLDLSNPIVNAFAYDLKGIIIHVGSEIEVKAMIEGLPMTVIDLEGKFVFPGFVDNHIHVPESGINSKLCQLPLDLSSREYIDYLYDCADIQTGTGWIRASGASLFGLRTTNSNLSESPIKLLDDAFPDRPVMVLDDVGHAVWTNTLGLNFSGVHPEASNPAGGIYERDGNNNLTGLLLENAQHKVRNAATLSSSDLYNGLLEGMEIVAANGVTTVSDAGGYWTRGHVEVWAKAAIENKLKVRTCNAFYLFPDMDMDEQIEKLKKLQSQNMLGADRISNQSSVNFNTIKIYVDGILSLGTAALIDDYNVPIDQNLTSGFLYFSEKKLNTYVERLHEMGFKLHFHAVGDLAIRMAVNAIETIYLGKPEELEKKKSVSERRHRVTHSYLIHEDDYQRFNEIGLIVDMQMATTSITQDYADFMYQHIRERADHIIPLKRILEENIKSSLSSDWDADPLSPIKTIHRAINRPTNNNSISVEEAVKLITIEAAYALSLDHATGSISPGKFADFVILDTNIYDAFDVETGISTVDQIQVLVTYLSGKMTYNHTK